MESLASRRVVRRRRSSSKTHQRRKRRRPAPSQPPGLAARSTQRPVVLGQVVSGLRLRSKRGRVGNEMHHVVALPTIVADTSTCTRALHRLLPPGRRPADDPWLVRRRCRTQIIVPVDGAMISRMQLAPVDDSALAIVRDVVQRVLAGPRGAARQLRSRRSPARSAAAGTTSSPTASRRRRQAQPHHRRRPLERAVSYSHTRPWHRLRCQAPQHGSWPSHALLGASPRRGRSRIL